MCTVETFQERFSTVFCNEQMTKNEYAENPPQIGEEGLEYSFSCQGLNRLKHPQKIQRRREMQLEHFTFMLIKHPEKSNADAKFV